MHRGHVHLREGVIERAHELGINVSKLCRECVDRKIAYEEKKIEKENRGNAAKQKPRNADQSERLTKNGVRSDVIDLG